MMESMMNLPDDMFKQELIPYLTVHDIVKLDDSCMNHEYRPQLLDKISGVILIGDKDRSMKASLFKWSGMRRIYLIKMKFLFKDDYTFPSSIENDYVDQFRYTQHVEMIGPIRDGIAIFIISHCPCLLSIDISGYSRLSPQWIAEHCTGLQSLSLSCCLEVTDAGLIIISEHCPNLKSLKINNFRHITDASIISISTNCTGLQSLNLGLCHHITDASIISISIHCTGLQSLNLRCCGKITNASIISISIHWIGLQSLNVIGCYQITDASIILLSTHCTGLQELFLDSCRHITDASIISISENRTGLKKLHASFTSITDASLIAIAKNCSKLQSLRTYRCDGLSSDELYRHFKSVSELRAVLLSIYPSLPI